MNFVFYKIFSKLLQEEKNIQTGFLKFLADNNINFFTGTGLELQFNCVFVKYAPRIFIKTSKKRRLYQQNLYHQKILMHKKGPASQSSKNFWKIIPDILSATYKNHSLPKTASNYSILLKITLSPNPSLSSCNRIL